MDLHVAVKKGCQTIYFYDEIWTFDNTIDKDWFWFLILIYNREIYMKLIYNITLTFNEKKLVKYYLQINYAKNVLHNNNIFTI